MKIYSLEHFHRKQKLKMMTIMAVVTLLTVSCLMTTMTSRTSAKNPNQPDSIEWLPPLSVTDEFQSDRYVVIKFLIQNETGTYLWDQSVRITVVNQIYRIVHEAEYQAGGNGRGNVRIVTNRFYMTYWNPAGTGGQYTIYVTFDDWPGVQFSKTVYVT